MRTTDNNPIVFKFGHDVQILMRKCCIVFGKDTIRIKYLKVLFSKIGHFFLNIMKKKNRQEIIQI